MFKKKVPMEEVVGILEYGLLLLFREESLTNFTDSIDYKLETEEDKKKLIEELAVFGTWAIIYICENAIKDENKRNTCLDLFLQRVENTYLLNLHPDLEIQDLRLMFTSKLDEYDEAFSNSKEPGPVWWISKVLNKNLCGEEKKDIFIQGGISQRIHSYILNMEQTLGKRLKKVEII